MEKTRIERVKGTRDILPSEYMLREQASKIIIEVFEKFGYRGVELPTLEQVDLHIRKSGEEIRRRMYAFEDQGHDNVCLRPELTASVVRMYNTEMQTEPLPLKLYYMGSSFRYDRPQKGRYREFTQIGVELIGGKTPEFDAETIALACNVMDALGIHDYEVVIGNIGITLELLRQKKIEDRAQNYIIESLETLSKAASREDAISKMREELDLLGIYNVETSEYQRFCIRSRPEASRRGGPTPSWMGYKYYIWSHQRNQ